MLVHHRLSRLKILSDSPNNWLVFPFTLLGGGGGGGGGGTVWRSFPLKKTRKCMSPAVLKPGWGSL